MKVSLIGAGPGDPGLFTLKGRDVLARADVVVYDYLAAESLLAYARADAELIYAGKQGGDHSMPQGEINALLVRKAKEGKLVARLKGGDPYMFGRGGEEAEALVAAGVDFEVVPGVTSGIAAPAYAGIPLTHRSCASSVLFATGHEDPGKAESAHNWDAMARSGATLVFYMGMKNLPEIARRLTEAGLDADTPAALVQWGTTPRHRSLLTTLGRAPAEAAEHAFSAPALIVVGRAAALRDTLNSFEKRPLFGKGVVVTRAREQASETAAMLEELGAEVILFPTIEIVPLGDCDAAPAMQAEEPTLSTGESGSPHLPPGSSGQPAAGPAFRDALARYGMVIFTSVNGVNYFWKRLRRAGLDSRALAGSELVCIGPATAGALRGHGLEADLLPENYVAESVAEGILKHYAGRIADMRILLPRALKARDALPKLLSTHCAGVDVLPLYDTVPAGGRRDEVLEKAASGVIRCITFGSSSTVENFLKLISAEILRGFPQIKFACIGPITASTLEKAGLPCHIMPREYTIPALVNAVADAL
ncbi:MAG: uroporphyrinogen-III C-methyltransferase [Desulfovibrio sp.]|jgi:uroporphyrinogen III methyltransferase/synthase|nr:uroporphyrinogen-III C-methyltransferase [Desulfovibrio sp.]